MVRLALSWLGDKQDARARQRALWVESLASAVPLLFLLIKSITYDFVAMVEGKSRVANSIRTRRAGAKALW
jgi:hypothetical protein